MPYEIHIDIETATDEEIRAERERIYLELWPDPWKQIEYMSINGPDSIYAVKNSIRKVLPYSGER